MNERIRKLIRKLDNEIGRYYWTDKEKEKFAELIVKECAKVVADAVDHREPASTYVGKIKEHFGQGKSQDDWKPAPDLA